MLLHKLRILVVFQIPDNKSSLPAESYLKFIDWEDERDVIWALKKQGNSPFIFGLKSDIKELIEEITRVKPDLVFNLCETFQNKREHEANIPAICDLLNVPYTGASPFALHLCQDKAIQKKILSYDQEVKIPHFMTIEKNKKILSLGKINYPAIVKPLNLEASEGISQKSYVNNIKNCHQRINFIKEKLNSDVIIEDYIEGTDVYLALIGKEGKKILVGEPVQLIFSKYPDAKKTIATYRTKWDSNYRKKWGIKTVVMEKSKLTKKIQQICLKTYSKLKLSGYVRFDMRITKKNECFFLEANPNPSIAKNDEFSKSAAAKGLDYLKLINKIVSISL